MEEKNKEFVISKTGKKRSRVVTISYRNWQRIVNYAREVLNHILDQWEYEYSGKKMNKDIIAEVMCTSRKGMEYWRKQYKEVDDLLGKKTKFITKKDILDVFDFLSDKHCGNSMIIGLITKYGGNIDEFSMNAEVAMRSAKENIKKRVAEHAYGFMENAFQDMQEEIVARMNDKRFLAREIKAMHYLNKNRGGTEKK